MKRLLSLVVLVYSLSSPVLAESVPSMQPAYESAYAFATSETQKNGAVFMTIHGYSIDDKIIAASSDVAERVELHTHAMDGDVMRMREVESFDLPHNSTWMLKPMGDHIMLMGLKHPLKEGEHFKLTLDLEKSNDIVVDVEVIKPGMKPEAKHDQHGHDNHHDDHHHDH